MIAPRGGFFTRDNRWAVENEGVAPDVDVENWPKDVIGIEHSAQFNILLGLHLCLPNTKAQERHPVVEPSWAGATNP